MRGARRPFPFRLRAGARRKDQMRQKNEEPTPHPKTSQECREIIREIDRLRKRAGADARALCGGLPSQIRTNDVTHKRSRTHGLQRIWLAYRNGSAYIKNPENPNLLCLLSRARRLAGSATERIADAIARVEAETVDGLSWQDMPSSDPVMRKLYWWEFKKGFFTPAKLLAEKEEKKAAERQGCHVAA